MTDSEDKLLTVWGHWIIHVWSTDSWTQLHEFKLLDYFNTLDARRHCISLGNVTDDRFLLVSANVEPKSRDHNSSCVFDISTGKFISNSFARKENVNILQKINVVGMGALLQTLEDEPKKLQWIGIGQSGDSVVMDETEVGLYTNSMRMSDNAAQYVTWCSEPQEKTIRLWGVVEGRLNTIGAFTPDEEVDDVHLVSDDNIIIINTASGLIQLQLCGRDIIRSPSSPRQKAPVDYEDIQLHIEVKSEN